MLSPNEELIRKNGLDGIDRPLIDIKDRRKELCEFEKTLKLLEEAEKRVMEKTALLDLKISALNLDIECRFYTHSVTRNIAFYFKFEGRIESFLLPEELSCKLRSSMASSRDRARAFLLEDREIIGYVIAEVNKLWVEHAIIKAAFEYSDHEKRRFYP